MDLTCSLSPLVYAELYAFLLEKKSWADTLEDRLVRGGLDLQWLDEASVLYRRHWLSVSEYEPMTCITAEHAHLASWILAALMLKEPSSDFSSELRERIRARYGADQGAEIGVVPEPFAVIVVAWTLGKVVGEYDIELPVVPAVLPTDVDIAKAYLGLVEHVAALPRPTPWPEMLGSATHWRGAGIAESLRPFEPPNLATSIGTLVRQARPHLTQRRFDDISRHWIREDFVARRNALTHVRSTGSVSFADASQQASDHQAIRPTVAGVTQFVCQQVAAELADAANRPPWGTKWTSLQNEITVW
ncbi:hypothetical protein E3O47_07555 [Cryobacterium sp. TMT2-17-1]|uniref:hypothetical protein n=1 Tax=Cryobacterium sp. TMT2-17-1 TaxID=1259248 RepID=UPI001069DC15|nr:hypothetical protein [Cryobacterium sp. TMT2-17-1]TFC50855.1 hypothetical protein E3O47_07555 [Cryobacterium sp. TMT2-17-1]